MKQQFNPIWIEGRNQRRVSKYTSLSIPHMSDDAASSIKRIGYDTAILGSFGRSEEVLSTSSSACFSKVRAQGIRIGLKATFDIDLMTKKFVLSPLNEFFRKFIEEEIDQIFKAVPPFDFLVYESLALIFDEMGLNQDDEHLNSEKARLEIALIEEMIRDRSGLLYILPGQDLHFLKELALDAGQQTGIMFSARLGDPFLDHLKINPFLLNSEPKELEGLQLATIVNAGAVQQGGGLWPSVAIDLVQSIYPHAIDLGITPIPCVHGLPKKGSFLEASLLIASKARSGKVFVEKELLLWLRENNYSEGIINPIKEVRCICVNLSLMRHLLAEKRRDHISQEEIKLIAASTLYRLRSLSKVEDRYFSDYLQFFVRDAARIILHFVQSFNVTLQETFESEPGKMGFWTEFEAGIGSGVRSLGKVSLSKLPLLNTECERMRAIYAEAGWS